jgi:hypothetical protein
MKEIDAQVAAELLRLRGLLEEQATETRSMRHLLLFLTGGTPELRALLAELHYIATSAEHSPEDPGDRRAIEAFYEQLPGLGYRPVWYTREEGQAIRALHERLARRLTW